MSEYIDRAALKRELAPYEENDFSQQMDVILAIVDAQPTADVVEMRHGRWHLAEDAVFRCSECGRICYELDAPYCYCGARMDKEADHEVS